MQLFILFYFFLILDPLSQRWNSPTLILTIKLINLSDTKKDFYIYII